MTSRAGRAAGPPAAAGAAVRRLLPAPAGSRSGGTGQHDRAPRRYGQPSAVGSGGAAGLAAAVSPGPAAGRRQPRRTVHRRLGLLVLAAVSRRVAGRAAADGRRLAGARPRPGRGRPRRSRPARRSPPGRPRYRDRAGGPGPDPRLGHRTVTAAQVITSSSGTSRSTACWAVTLTPEGSGWLVWDIEPASAGNS